MKQTVRGQGFSRQNNKLHTEISELIKKSLTKQFAKTRMRHAGENEINLKRLRSPCL